MKTYNRYMYDIHTVGMTTVGCYTYAMHALHFETTDRRVPHLHNIVYSSCTALVVPCTHNHACIPNYTCMIAFLSIEIWGYIIYIYTHNNYVGLLVLVHCSYHMKFLCLMLCYSY